MVYSLVLGFVALLGLGLYSTTLVASLAEPVSLILAGVAAASIFIQVVRRGYLEDVFSSDTGEKIAAGILGAAGFYIAFVAGQSIITALSPLAGIVVVGLGVAVFVAGPGIIFDLLDVILGGD